MGASGSDGLARRLAFVGARIVEDDGIPLGQGRGERLPDIGGEEIAIDGSIDHPGRIDPVMAQCGDESEVLQCPNGAKVLSLWPLGPQPLSGAMLVLTHVSPTNTSRLGSILP